MITISDVAKFAGVSISTVSRVINNPSIVSDKTVLKVKHAIAELSFIPNAAGQALKRKSSRTLFIISSYALDNSEYISSIKIHAALHNLAVVLLPFFNHNTLIQYQENLFASFGVICLDFESISFSDLETLSNNTYLVFHCHNEDLLNLPKSSSHVFNQQYSLYYKMAYYFFKIGVHSICYPTVFDFINGTMAPVSFERKAAIESATREFSIPLANNKEVTFYGLSKNVLSDGGTLFGRMIAEGYIAMSTRPEAILCNTVMAAIGCIRALYEYGLRVPDDVFVSCLDGDLLASQYIPSITSFDSPFNISCQDMVSMIVAMHNGTTYTPHDITDFKLIQRESTSKP